MADHSSTSVNHAFIDLMTSLVVIFVLLLVSVLYQLKVANEPKTPGPPIIIDVTDDLTRKLKELGLSLEKDDDDPDFTRILRLDENLVRFEIGKDSLNSDGKMISRKVSKILSDVICQSEIQKMIESLIVEGHTDKRDDATIDGKLRNLDLSQKRAFAVMREAFYYFDESSQEAFECFRKIARATGRGSAKPYSKNSDNDDLNRRVEIKIRFKPKIST